MIHQLTYKRAEQPWEFEQIYRLNYETFVEEIPQHQQSDTRLLVDKFNDENTYFIALSQDQALHGMLAIRDRRPFSLDSKLENLDALIPPAKSMCEVRLLSVRQGVRNGVVLMGLLTQLYEYLLVMGYDLVLISGILNQQKLYRHIGFIPFGPVVGSGEARFQPMYLKRENIQIPGSILPEEIVSFLPGPVELPESVNAALSRPAVSHRSPGFLKKLDDIKSKLCALSKANYAEILTGSGTLANDVITAHLTLLGQKGLILSNGEFGERLIDHAKRFSLDFEICRKDWGDAFEPPAVERLLKSDPNIRWLFMVHCESSTGMLNPLTEIQALCDAYQVKLCVDVISALGNVDLDLRGVYMASATSSKGIGSYCGLGIVFYNTLLPPSAGRLPRSLDLHKFHEESGVPYTLSSNLVEALYTALTTIDYDKRRQTLSVVSHKLCEDLEALGLPPLISGSHAAAAILTISLPEAVSGLHLGDYLKYKGFLISYESAYLVRRNWIQVCLMGDLKPERAAALAEVIKTYVKQRAELVISKENSAV